MIPTISSSVRSIRLFFQLTAICFVVLASSGCSVIFSPELPAMETAGCMTSADCASEGNTFICRNEACVNVETANCSLVQGPLQADNTLILGAIQPTSGANADIGEAIVNGQSLAIEEINSAGGLPGARRIALVACDSAGSEQQGLAVADHLTNIVGVPAITGPAFSGIFVSVTTQVTAPAGVLTISPSATAPEIADLEDQNLAWRTVANDLLQGAAIADLIKERAYGKVIALGIDNLYGRGLLNLVSQELGPELGEDNFLNRTYPDPASTNNVNLVETVVAALDQMPDADAIAILGTSEAVQMMELFEEAIASSSTTAVDINYIFADGGKSAAPGAIGRNNSLLSRIEGTEPFHENGDVFTNFNLRYLQEFGVPAPTFSANSYDGIYLIAFAASTLDAAQSITGSALATAMSRLVMGDKLPAQPNDFGRGRNLLSGGSDVDFDGASGTLDFDLTTGEAATDVALWVFEERGSNSFRDQRSGLYRLDDMGGGQWNFDQ